MKNRKSLYILLPAVLVIWGAVAYQFFSFFDQETTEETIQGSYAGESVKIKPIDTSSIDVDYRDPFLGKMYSSVPKKTLRKFPKKTSVAEKPLPKISYKGIVSDTKNKSKVFMVIIEGQTFLMKKGNREKDILLIDGNRKSVDVKCGGKPYTIPIEN